MVPIRLLLQKNVATAYIMTGFVKNTIENGGAACMFSKVRARFCALAHFFLRSAV